MCFKLKLTEGMVRHTYFSFRIVYSTDYLGGAYIVF